MKAKKIIALVALSGSMLVSSAAMAGDPLLGALVGGTFGAVVGNSVGGHDGAVVGGLLGAVIGADSASNRYYDYGPSYGYSASYGYGPSYGYGATIGVYPAPIYAPPVVYAPPRVIYRRAPRVVYEGYRYDGYRHHHRYESRRGHVRYERPERHDRHERRAPRYERRSGQGYGMDPAGRP